MTSPQAVFLVEKFLAQENSIKRSGSKEKKKLCAKKLFKLHGLRLSKSIPYEYQNRKMKDSGPEINIHNVHHFMVAPQDRKLKPDFGLGSPPSVRYNLEPLISDSEAEVDESLTACLDYIRSIHEGYALSEVQYFPDPQDFITLFNRGLITKTGKIRQPRIKKKKPQK